jgi:hypothetical protein
LTINTHIRRALLTLALAAAPAAAHVAPSPDANNRYCKITLLGGSVRLAYTVFYGDRPGQAERRRMDRNGDGTIDAAEAAAFGAGVLHDVAPSLAVEIDGRAPLGAWSVADVGLGTPTVAGGAFSVDLVLDAPLPRAADPEHTVRFDDRWQVPSPGEAETRVEESPGVHVLVSARDTGTTPRGVELRFAFTGNPHDDRAIAVRFRADPELRVQVEPAGPAASSDRFPWHYVFVGGGGLALLALVWTNRRLFR